jgi:hypothetical protein
MDRATRHVGKAPAWVKGSPINERPAPSGCFQYQIKTERGGSESKTGVKLNPIPSRA